MLPISHGSFAYQRVADRLSSAGERLDRFEMLRAEWNDQQGAISEWSESSHLRLLYQIGHINLADVRLPQRNWACGFFFFSGKGGVGKTSVAAATGVHLARTWQEDSHHERRSRAQPRRFFRPRRHPVPRRTFDPVQIAEGSFCRKSTSNRELKRHWKDISVYITSVLRTTGLLGRGGRRDSHLPRHGRDQRHDVCESIPQGERLRRDRSRLRPTAESLRFISLPATLDGT